MKRMWDSIKNLLSLLEAIIAASTVLAAAIGFLLKQPQWGILIALVILLTGSAVIHLLRVQYKSPITEFSEQVFKFERRQRVTAGIFLAGILLVSNVFLFLPGSSRWIQSTFWSSAPGSRPLEQLNYLVFEFSGSPTTANDTGNLTYFNVYDHNKASSAFQLEYALPKPVSSNYAGFSIRLTPQVDVSKYSKIAFTLTQSDSQARVRVSLKDAAKNDNAILLGDAKYAGGSSEESQEILIPLSDFPDIVTTMVKEVVFSLDGTIARGSGSVVVSNVRFIR